MGGLSYPSGHAVNEVVGLRLAAALLARPGRDASQRRAVLLAVVLAVVVAVGGVSVVVADFHWASDVLAGWLLGGCLLSFGYALGAGRLSAGRTRRPSGGLSSRS